MKVLVYDSHHYEKDNFLAANAQFNHELSFYEGKLNVDSASMAKGYECICAFVNDNLKADVLKVLSQVGVKLIALRSAGFNHVDLDMAKELNLKVVRVPEYSPYSVAEHAFALILTLNRKIHRAYNRVREGNFSLDGLVGFDLHGKTIGVLGTGKIGRAFIQIAKGFGCEVLAYDVSPVEEYATKLGFKYVSLDEVLSKSSVISLHIPLTPKTHHLIDKAAIDRMKDGVMLINTGRGGLVDTKSLIDSLKTGKMGAAGLDVYEEEEKYFFQDHSGFAMTDDVLARLMTFSNVLLTGHQGFLTKEALGNIASTTLANISSFEKGQKLENEVNAN